MSFHDQTTTKTAGLPGWLLARSIVETRDLFRARFIHFLQDVVILGALLVVNPV